jgi:hypothetical protein
MAPPLEPDLKAGYTGLIVAAIFLGSILYGIVHLTNVKYSTHEAPAAAQH